MTIMISVSAVWEPANPHRAAPPPAHCPERTSLGIGRSAPMRHRGTRVCEDLDDPGDWPQAEPCRLVPCSGACARGLGPGPSRPNGRSTGGTRHSRSGRPSCTPAPVWPAASRGSEGRWLER